MFNRIISAIAGNYNERKIKLMFPLVKEINDRCDEFDALHEDEIKEKTQYLKDLVQKYEKEDTTKETKTKQIIPEHIMIDAFALVKQACKRLLGVSYIVKWVEQTRNMVPYDVQIIGGINLHNGLISEMKTWEWKTLVATMPAYLNALSDKGVHIVTVNDYLVSRDSDQMKILFEYLWLTVGCVTKAVPLHQRKEEYAKDITYVENSELGFDYLRDNLAKSMQERNVLRRPLHYAIVDEVDSILIDESRTPLIISEPDAEPTEKYLIYAQLVNMLIPSKTKKKISKWFLHDILQDAKDWKKEETDMEIVWDYYVDEKTKTVSLSSEGIEKLEKMLKVDNLYKDLWYEEIHHIENALKASACYEEGKEYIINNGEIVIIDENTGRAQQGRRFSQWLHQAIEAKEKVTIQRESKTLATITYQNFFKQYTKLAWMTGTATTEGEEFDNIYNLHVLAIPTNKQVIRVDFNDRVYFNQNAKRNHVLEQILFSHEMWQPLLIWTSSIQTSEFVSSLLKKNNIMHSVLNAKFHEQEAQIISRAGKIWSVVVATNMAGRGTDIKIDSSLNEEIAENYALWIENMLSGNTKEKKSYNLSLVIYSEKEYNFTIDALKRKLNISEDILLGSYGKPQILSSGYVLNINFTIKKRDKTFAIISLSHPDTLLEDSIVKNIHYGLGIIWTEKHESRRIDNQLRGRAGRQGDPGMSVFYVALDDTIMRKMGGEKIQSVASLLLPQKELENLELVQSQFTQSIIRAQKQMEWRHFWTRKHLFDYDSVIDKQRQAVYHKRDFILHTLEQQLSVLYGEEYKNKKSSAFQNKSILDTIIDIIQPTIYAFLEAQQILGTSKENLIETINKEFNLKLDLHHISDNEYNRSAQHIAEHIISNLNDAKDAIGEEEFTKVCATIYLYTIDKHRVEHIDEMQYLREKVGLMGYAQLDPLVIYKKESYDKYKVLLEIVDTSTIATIANANFSTSIQSDTSQEEIISPNVLEWLDLIMPSPDNDQNISLLNPNSKYRPNDKINVRYADGTIKWDVKYKIVKDDILTKKCQVI